MDIEKIDRIPRGRMRVVARDYYGVFVWMFDTDRAVRRKTVGVILATHATFDGVRDRAASQCAGVRLVTVSSPEPGRVLVRLRHSPLGWFWRRGNLRRVRAALDDFRPATCSIEVQ